MSALQSWLDTLGPYAAAIPSIIALYVLLRQEGTIKLLEKNTNSIKDALILSTAKASRLQGKEEQRAEMEEKR